MKKISSVGLMLVAGLSFAQFNISAELRPRFEYRHGYKELFAKGDDAASFVSQRSRLNAGYSNEGLELYVSLQDVRVWGDVPQLNVADNNGLSVHEAWGKFKFGTGSSVKLGRQEIVYDDHRFFGNVGWTQQGRSHDAALYSYKRDSYKLDLGFAYNQDKEKLSGNVLATESTYKAMQYVWMHKDWSNFSGSLLFANVGWQDKVESETRYNQTIGTHLKYKANGLDVAGNAYYQFGKDVMNNDLRAYLLGLNVNYQVDSNLNLGIGGEIQSGNDNSIIKDKKNNAFTPFFGTNHKFNGWMDYFYVGKNHINSIGLVDLEANAKYKVQDKTTLNLAVHKFNSSADFQEKSLGAELDFSVSHNLQKDVNIQLGYSHMFESEGLELINGKKDSDTSNWAWVMVTFKPTLFTSK